MSITVCKNCGGQMKSSFSYDFGEKEGYEVVRCTNCDASVGIYSYLDGHTDVEWEIPSIKKHLSTDLCCSNCGTYESNSWFSVSINKIGDNSIKLNRRCLYCEKCALLLDAGGI